MSLLNRLRPGSQASLPANSSVGFRWSALSRQRRTSVGIDFGAGSMKVVQVRWTRQGPRLENYAVLPVAKGAMEEGAVRDPAMAGDLLRAALQHMGMSQSQVGTCLGGPGILMRYINLPKVSPDEMRQAMKFEAPQHLPIPEDDLIYDYSPVPEAVGVPEHQMAVFLAGTHKRLVDSVLATLARAKLRSTAIELDCLAALRALQWTGLVSHNGQHPLVMLDCGEVGTRISVVRYGVPMLSRTIPMGLEHLRTMVSDTLQVSMSEAEISLRLNGVGPNTQLTPAVEPWLTSLTEAVGRSVEFFLIQNRGAIIERAFLVGGGAALPYLPEALSSALRMASGSRAEGEGLRVQPVGLAGLDINPELLPGVNSFGPMLMTALGSALREGSPE